MIYTIHYISAIYLSALSTTYIYICIYIYIHTIYPFDIHIHIHWFMVVPYHLLSHRLTASRESLAVASGVVSFPQISSGAKKSAAFTPGSGHGSGGFRCRYLVRFRRVPVKIYAEAPEGSVRFRTVPVQIPCEVPEGSGADTL